MAGLVITDIGGGDYCVAFVPDDLWNQIQDLTEVVNKTAPRSYAETFSEWVSWLTATRDMDKDMDGWRPKGCPDRIGRVTDTWYCQAPVIEPANIVDNIDGIICIRR